MGSTAAVQTLERFFTTNDIADRYHVAASTARYWRHIDYGPKGAKVGRRFLYPETEVRRFDAEIAARARPTISQPPEPDNGDGAGAATPTPLAETHSSTL